MKTEVQKNKEINAANSITSTKVQDGKLPGKTVTKITAKPLAKK